MSQLVFLMGVSGAGKNTIQDVLFDDDMFVGINTTTTRPMRAGEEQGVQYDFVTDEVFQGLIDDDDFIEYALVHKKYYYGTRKSLVQSALGEWKTVLKQVDMAWWEQILKQDDVRSYARSVFMDIDDETIKTRILLRDPSTEWEEIERRIESAQYERAKAQELCDIYVDVSVWDKETQLAEVRALIEWLHLYS